MVEIQTPPDPDHAISLANKNAAVAAIPPMTIVCAALRTGPVPVKRPFINPNMPKAANVTTAEASSPRDALARII